MIVARHDDPTSACLTSQIDGRYPFPFQPGYSRHLRDSNRGELVLLFSDCGKTCAAFRLFRKRWLRLAQFEYPPVRGGSRIDVSEERDFLNRTVEYLRTTRLCHRLIQPANYCLFRAVPEGSVSCSFGSYVLPLRDRSEEELFRGMHPDHRRKIRNATKQGACVKFGPAQLATFYEIHSETMRRSGIGTATMQELQSMCRHMANPPMVLCGVVYADGQPQGSLLLTYTQRRAFFLYGGSRESVSISGAIKLLHWEAIRHLRAAGVDEYDFVGARLSDVKGLPLEHIQRFKARFGCELETGYLWKMDVVKWLPKCFDLASAVKRRLKSTKHTTRDIIDQEIRRAKSD